MIKSSRRGAANLTPLLMVFALALMVAFLVWLGFTAEGTEPVAMSETGESEITMDSLALAAADVAPGVLELDAGQYVGQLVRVEGSVAQTLGPVTLFMLLANNPFLVRLSDASISEGATVPGQGADVEVIGTVREMNDSIMARWREEGSIPEGDMLLIEIQTHFVDAERVESTGGAPATAPDSANGGDAAGNDTN